MQPDGVVWPGSLSDALMELLEVEEVLAPLPLPQYQSLPISGSKNLSPAFQKKKKEKRFL